MGIKKLTWKKTGAILVIIATIITIATNLKFVWNCLKSFGSLIVKLVSPLTTPIFRDIILLIIIVCILIWLILTNKKLKELSRVYKGELKVNIKEEVEKIKLDRKRQYVLLFFADAKGEEKLEDLYDFYKGEFGEELTGRIEFNIIVNDLEKAELIIHTGTLGSDKFYAKTSKGLDVVKEIL